MAVKLLDETHGGSLKLGRMFALGSRTLPFANGACKGCLAPGIGEGRVRPSFGTKLQRRVLDHSVAARCLWVFAAGQVREHAGAANSVAA